MHSTCTSACNMYSNTYTCTFILTYHYHIPTHTHAYTVSTTVVLVGNSSFFSQERSSIRTTDSLSTLPMTPTPSRSVKPPVSFRTILSGLGCRPHCWAGHSSGVLAGCVLYKDYLQVPTVQVHSQLRTNNIMDKCSVCITVSECIRLYISLGGLLWSWDLHHCIQHEESLQMISTLL